MGRLAELGIPAALAVSIGLREVYTTDLGGFPASWNRQQSGREGKRQAQFLLPIMIMLAHDYSRYAVGFLPDLDPDVVWQPRKEREALQRLLCAWPSRSISACMRYCHCRLESGQFSYDRWENSSFCSWDGWRFAKEAGQKREIDEFEEIEAPNHLDQSAFELDSDQDVGGPQSCGVVEGRSFEGFTSRFWCRGALSPLYVEFNGRS